MNRDTRSGRVARNNPQANLPENINGEKLQDFRGNYHLEDELLEQDSELSELNEIIDEASEVDQTVQEVNMPPYPAMECGSDECRFRTDIVTDRPEILLQQLQIHVALEHPN